MQSKTAEQTVLAHLIANSTSEATWNCCHFNIPNMKSNVGFNPEKENFNYYGKKSNKEEFR